MKKLISSIVFGAAVLSAAACSEDMAPTVTSPSPSVSYGKAVGSGFANPNGPTWMQGQFTLSYTIVSGSEDGVNQHPQGKGYCVGTVWYNPNGHPTNAKFCQGTTVSITSVVVCTMDPNSLPATYALAAGGATGAANDPGTSQTAGNENLNFHSDLIPDQLDQFVHYQAKKGATTGKDYTVFTFTCDDGTTGDARLDLGQFAGPGNKFKFLSGTQRQLNVTGVKVDPTDSEGNSFSPPVNLDFLSWTYRSRVGSI